jgi:hypothetical protein
VDLKWPWGRAKPGPGPPEVHSATLVPRAPRTPVPFNGFPFGRSDMVVPDLHYFRLRNRASGPEIVDFVGLICPLLPQNLLGKVCPPAFRALACDLIAVCRFVFVGPWGLRSRVGGLIDVVSDYGS